MSEHDPEPCDCPRCLRLEAALTEHAKRIGNGTVTERDRRHVEWLGHQVNKHHGLLDPRAQKVARIAAAARWHPRGV